MTHQQIIELFSTLQNQNKKYASFHKAELHIHTPASDDYRLNSKVLLKDATDEEVVSVAIKHGLIKPEQKNTVLSGFSSKELIVYEIIAKQLYNHKVRIATIADHNSIDGYEKLNSAIKSVKQKFNYKYHIDLFPGIEITCNNKSHVVGIFNHSKESLRYIGRMIESLGLDKDGTIRDPVFVVRSVKKARGLVYLAHFDNTDLGLTLKYQQAMFSDENLDAISLSKCSDDKINFYKNKFKKELDSRKQNLIFICDGDSHSVDEIGKRPIWIKSGTINFTNIRHAFEDRPTRVLLEAPKPNVSSIMGISILSGQKGFLIPKNPDEILLIPFSQDLNTIVGGRGSGKTTILNLLEWTFSKQCRNQRELKFLLQFDHINIYIHIEGKSYVLILEPKKYWDSYTEEWKIDFSTINMSDYNSNRSVSIDKWVSMRQIVSQKHSYRLSLVKKNTDSIISNVYKRLYSLSSIIHTVENGKFSGFIKNALHISNYNSNNSSKTEQIKHEILCNVNNGEQIVGLIDNIRNELNKLQDKNEKFIETLNSKVKHKLKIKKSHDLIKLRCAIMEGIPKTVGMSNKYKLFLSDVIIDILEKIDFLTLVKAFIRDDNDIMQSVDWSSVTPEKRKRHADDLLDYSANLAFKNLKNILLNNLLSDCLEAYIEDKIGEYELYFNINYREGEKGEYFKNINELSLGQKGIAILTFIFETSRILKDYSPLILDQPEDHLDNLYIYKNIITDLRKIKNNKQVILATHNPSIVMAGDAEQVLCMASDGRNGWIEKQGSADNDNIVKFIICLMEGGRDCLELRLKKYNYKCKNLCEDFI